MPAVRRSFGVLFRGELSNRAGMLRQLRPWRIGVAKNRRSTYPKSCHCRSPQCGSLLPFSDSLCRFCVIGLSGSSRKLPRHLPRQPETGAITFPMRCCTESRFSSVSSLPFMSLGSSLWQGQSRRIERAGSPAACLLEIVCGSLAGLRLPRHEPCRQRGLLGIEIETLGKRRVGHGLRLVRDSRVLHGRGYEDGSTT